MDFGANTLRYCCNWFVQYLKPEAFTVSGYIYALRDKGYSRGIKIGRDKSPYNRYKHSQCFTPRGIELVARWSIPAELGSLHDLEKQASKGLIRIENPNSGVEWFDVDRDQVIECVSANLGLRCDLIRSVPPITSTWDAFRDPKHLTGTEKHRQFLCVYVENCTNSVKVQRTCDWDVPLEERKTYSLLGFRPVAFMGTFEEKNIKINNERTHQSWLELVTKFGFGEHHLQVGWLKPNVSADVVRDYLVSKGFRQWSESRLPNDVRSKKY